MATILDIKQGKKPDEHPFGHRLEEMDIDAFMNLRTWLQDACREAGAELTGAGIGMGIVTIGIILDNQRYSIHARPLPKTERMVQNERSQDCDSLED